MSDKYTEIFKLRDMLDAVGVPYEFVDETQETVFLPAELYRLCYPVADPERRVCSVIQGWCTYGGDYNLVEIMGLLTPQEQQIDDMVKGFLTANEVFERIWTYHNKFVLSRAH